MTWGWESKVSNPIQADMAKRCPLRDPLVLQSMQLRLYILRDLISDLELLWCVSSHMSRESIIFVMPIVGDTIITISPAWWFFRSWARRDWMPQGSSRLVLLRNMLLGFQPFPKIFVIIVKHIRIKLERLERAQSIHWWREHQLLMKIRWSTVIIR